jgi:hypothetical protein
LLGSPAAERFRFDSYNREVARGWESKSVEAQQAEAGSQPAELRAKMSPEEAQLFRARENLRLARERVFKQLAACTNPRYRQVLENALADLDRKLGQFER